MTTYQHTHRAGCSCGDASDHIVARRRTADGQALLLWSDGLLTWGFGFRIRGIGRARSAYKRRLNLEAGWVVIGLAEVLNASEVTGAIAAARTEVRLDLKHGVGIDRARLERRTLAKLPAVQ